MYSAFLVPFLLMLLLSLPCQALLRIAVTYQISGQVLPVDTNGNTCSDPNSSLCWGGFARLKTSLFGFLANGTATGDDTLVVSLGASIGPTLFFKTYSTGADPPFYRFLGELPVHATLVAGTDWNLGVEAFAGFLSASTGARSRGLVAANMDLFSFDQRLRGAVLDGRLVTLASGLAVGVVGIFEDNNLSSPFAADTSIVRYSDIKSAVSGAAGRLRAIGAQIIVLLGTGRVAGYYKSIATDIPKGIDLVIADEVGAASVTGGSSIFTDPYVLNCPISLCRWGQRISVAAFRVPAAGAPAPVRWESERSISLVEGSAGYWLQDGRAAQDPDMARRIDLLAQPLLASFTTVLAQAPARFVGDRSVCRLRACNLGRLIAEAMRWKHLLDPFAGLSQRPDPRAVAGTVSLFNSGSIRASISAGPVTELDLLRALPFGDTFTAIRVKGSVLARALRLAWTGWELANSTANGQGRFLQVAGLRYTYNTKSSSIVWADVLDNSGATWNPLRLDLTYDVTTTGYIASGGDGYKISPKLAMAPPNDMSVVELIAAFLRSGNLVTPYGAVNITTQDLFSQASEGATAIMCPPGSSLQVESDDCSLCDPGFFGSRGDTCLPCSDTSYSSVPGQDRCTPCPSGSRVSEKRAATSVLQCLCREGTRKSVLGVVVVNANSSTTTTTTTTNSTTGNGTVGAQASFECLPCSRTTFAPLGSLECISCPPHSQVLGTTAASVADCTCEVGYYGKPWANVTCQRCPEGLFCSDPESGVARPGFYSDVNGTFFKCPRSATCEGRFAPPIATKDHWADALSPTAFLKCLPGPACPGGLPAGECPPGYSGKVCAVCSSGFYRFSYSCLRCWPLARAAPALFVILAILVVLLLLRASSSVVRDSATLGICTKFFQVLFIIGHLDVNWPESVMNASRYVSVPFSFNDDFLALECSFEPRNSFLSRWGITLLLPFFSAVLFTGLFCAVVLSDKLSELWRRARGPRQAEPVTVVVSTAEGLPESRASVLYDRCRGAFILSLSLLYMLPVRACLEFFACSAVQADGTYALKTSPNLSCFTSWWYKTLPVALFATALYVAVVPLVFFLVIQRNRLNLDDVAFRRRWGPIFLSYRSSAATWGTLDLVEKVAFAATSTLVSFFVSLQIATITLILVVGILMTSNLRPFRKELDYRTQLALRFHLLAFSFCAMAFHANTWPREESTKNIIEGCSNFIVGTGSLLALTTALYAKLASQYQSRVRLKAHAPAIKLAAEMFTDAARFSTFQLLRSSPDFAASLERSLRRVKDDIRMLPQPSSSSSSSSPTFFPSSSPPAPPTLACAALVSFGTRPIFQDRVVPKVFQWLLLHPSGQDTRLLISCITSISARIAQEIGSNSSSSSRSPSAEMSLRTRYTLRRGGAASAHKAPPPSQDDLSVTSRLLQTLYGALYPANVASKKPGLLSSQAFLSHLHLLHLDTHQQKGAVDDGEDVAVHQDNSSSNIKSQGNNNNNNNNFQEIVEEENINNNGSVHHELVQLDMPELLPIDDEIV
jgi:5'-nucleotidase/UDP-sugar diphosphatase